MAARDGMQKRKRIGRKASIVGASTNDIGKDIGFITKDKGNGNMLSVSNG
jgi:hypothetical protein